jgi:hypothetical protein
MTRWLIKELDGERRSKRIHVQLMDARIKLRREEYAESMGQRSKSNYAASKGAQIKSSMEQYA